MIVTFFSFVVSVVFLDSLAFFYFVTVKNGANCASDPFVEENVRLDICLNFLK